MSSDLPGGITRRRFLEDVLDSMGDAQVIVLDDGTEVDRAALLTELAKEMDPPWDAHHSK